MNTADLSAEQRTILAQVTHLLIQQSLHISDDLFIKFRESVKDCALRDDYDEFLLR